MTTMTVNGRTINVPNGKNLTVRNGRVFVDGVEYFGDGDPKPCILEVKITEGTIQEVNVDGSLSCNDIAGSVRIDGSMSCRNVGGNVTIDGSLQCNDIQGSVKADGSVMANYIYNRSK